MKKISRILTILLAIILFDGKVYAGNLSISASSGNVIVGNNVVITVKATSLAGTVNITSSNGAVLAGGASGVWFENETKTYTFRANSAGTATITVTPTNMGDFDTNGAYTTSRSVTITVKNKPVIILSGDNSLSSLGIEGANLSPEFSRDNYEYSVELEPETTKVNVVASPNHGGASINGMGEREVTDGDNRLEISVTAENGAVAKYYINAKVKEYNPIEATIDGNKYTVVRKKSQIEAPEGYTETTIKMNEEEIPAYYSEITNYTLVALKDSEGNQNFYVYQDGNYELYEELTFGEMRLRLLDYPKIPKNYEKGIFVYNDKNIEAYKLNQNSNYSLIYAMNINTGKTNYYLYESNENTVQIYNEEEINLYTEKVELYTYIIIGLLGFSFILLLIIVIIAFKKNSNKPKEKKKEKNKEEM